MGMKKLIVFHTTKKTFFFSFFYIKTYPNLLVLVSIRSSFFLEELGEKCV